MEASAVMFDPLEEIRAEIEEVAQDTTLDSDTRVARLQEFHADLTNLLGAVDTYLGDEGLVREAAEPKPPSAAVLKLRENADIREALIEKGTAPETCDDLMLYSHAELDDLAEEGLLEETAVHAELFMQHALKGKFDELKHPRGRGGKWRETLGHIQGLKDGERKHLGNGVHVKKVGGKIQVQHHRRTLSTHTTPENAAHAAQAALEAPPEPGRRPRAAAAPPAQAVKQGDQVTISSGPHRGKTGTVHSRSADGSLSIETPEGRVRMHEDAVQKVDTSETATTKDWIRKGTGKEPSPEERARVAAEHAQHQAESQLSPEEKKRLYDERKTALEQRAVESVKSAAQRGKLTDAEAHFNEAGKVSQRTLANYVEEASTKPQTIDLYSTVNSDGTRVWDRSRQQVHERIITAHLKKRKIDPVSGKPVLDYDPNAEDLQPHADGPQVLFSGGGYAAGKGGVLKILAARGETPPDSFTLDPDQIKAELPEFASMIGTDPEANMHVYREAWAIAQEIQARAMEKKLNIVVDGISDTSPEEMGQRAKAFTDRGYAARAVYVDIPTEEALKRAANRAVNAKDDSDRRMIPETIMRAVHRDVAATVPSLPGYLEDHKIPLQLEVWDNDQGKDDQGEFRPPKQFFAYHPDTGREVPDQDLWDRFVGKGHESITHVEGAM